MKDTQREIVELFETVSLGAPQNAVGFVMWRVMHRYVREVDQALRPVDLTHLQFTLLTLVAWMVRTGNSATQAELARFGDIHPMQVSNVLKALEQKSAIVRTAVPSSALAKHVNVTATGISSLRHALPIVIALQKRLFGDQGQPGGGFLDALVLMDRGGDAAADPHAP